MASFVQRVIGAARLNPAVYEEVEADKSATAQATMVVVLSAIAAGIGSIENGTKGVIITILAALLGWVLWAFLTWLIGTKFLAEPQTQADMGQLLRTIGFAASPGLIRVFGAVPFVGAFVLIAAWLWMLVSMVVAVRQALDYKGTWRAILVCAIGWFVYVLFFISAISMLGIAIIGLGGAINV
jgi:hypothetical protein